MSDTMIDTEIRKTVTGKITENSLTEPLIKKETTHSLKRRSTSRNKRSLYFYIAIIFSKVNISREKTKESE